MVNCDSIGRIFVNIVKRIFSCVWLCSCAVVYGTHAHTCSLSHTSLLVGIILPLADVWIWLRNKRVQWFPSSSIFKTSVLFQTLISGCFYFFPPLNMGEFSESCFVSCSHRCVCSSWWGMKGKNKFIPCSHRLVGAYKLELRHNIHNY